MVGGSTAASFLPGRFWQGREHTFAHHRLAASERYVPSANHARRNIHSISRLQFHRVVRRGFALAGGADADVAGLLAELREIFCTKITHAALDAADELREHAVHRADGFLERLNAFGGELARGVGLLMAVTRGTAGFHRGETSHAAILLVKFAAD